MTVHTDNIYTGKVNNDSNYHMHTTQTIFTFVSHTISTTVKPVLGTTCLRRPPAQRDHSKVVPMLIIDI